MVSRRLGRSEISHDDDLLRLFKQVVVAIGTASWAAEESGLVEYDELCIDKGFWTSSWFIS